MKDDNNDWIKAIRQKVESEETPLAAGGWESMERMLDSKAHERNVVPMWRRVALWSAAAVLLLLVVGGALVVTFSGKDSLEKQPIEIAQVKEESTEQEEPSNATVRPDAVAETNVASTAKANAWRNVANVAKGGETPKQVDEAVAEVVTETQQKNAKAEEKNAASGKTTEKDAEAQPRKTLREKMTESDNRLFIAKASNNNRGGGVSVYASGDLSGTNKGQVSQERLCLAQMYNSGGAFVPRLEEVHYRYKHKQPLTFGVKVSKSLPYNLSVSTGLNYTMLRTDVIEEGTQREFGQRLQFIGIPVGVNWTFVKYKRFSAYIGAEAQAEKCIEAQFDDEKQTIKEIQWSIHGVAGARFALTDNVSLFVEPKVSHYFNELPLKTIRNENDVNFNLQVGLSLNF